MELHELSLSQASRLLQSRQVSSMELTKAVLKQQEKTEPVLHCFITPTPELALSQARAADQRLAQGQSTPLTGIPLGLKDSICYQGVRTTAGSRMLHNFVPPYSATLANKLQTAGMVLVGKQNLDEFAMGSTTESSYFGPTRNPWDITAFPGGSSGGSAASLAIGSCLGAIGSDTGGSIRQPASHCGVIGFKPSYGLVSRYGLIGFASSLDQGGPLGRDMEDVALMLQAIVGYDELDQTSIPYEAPDYSQALKQPVKGLRLGLPQEYFVKGLEPEVERTVRRAVEKLASFGVQVLPITLPHTEYLISTYYIIATAETSSNLARYDGIKFGFSAQNNNSTLEDLYLQTRSQGLGQEVIRRIMLGTYVLSAGYYDAYYAKASQARTLIMNDFTQAFKQVDAIAAPIAPHAALDLGKSDDTPIMIYLRDIFTLSSNIAGLPAISLPAGFNSRQRPIGLQLMAPRFQENTLLALGAAFQLHTDFHQARPQTFAPGGTAANQMA